MAEKNRECKYIKCSRCNCKYLNNDYSILKDFGHNRLYEPFKTCRKCRENKKIQTTTIKILESAPILVLAKYNIPNSLIDNIMSYHSEICNCFPLDVYSKYKDKLEPYKKYIRPGNYKFESDTCYGWDGNFESLYLDIKVSKDMISSLIKNEVFVNYEYPSKYSITRGRAIITSYDDNRKVKINNYLLTINKFITLKLRICYCIITYG
jgi:hypothetical protein